MTIPTQLSKINYSLVIPVYNEEESLEGLVSEIQQAMARYVRCASYEIIFVNDGSLDQSTAILDRLRQRFPDEIRRLHFLKRGGQTFALRQGLGSARGNIVITLDGDLQNDPADIPRLLEKMSEGYDCVCGWRRSRQDTLLKAGLSKCGNILQHLLTGLSIHDVSCTLRVYKQECVARIPLNWEGQHRFIPLSLALQGYRVGEIVSHHRPRLYGKTKYSHQRIFRVVVDFFRILFARGK